MTVRYLTLIIVVLSGATMAGTAVRAQDSDTGRALLSAPAPEESDEFGVIISRPEQPDGGDSAPQDTPREEQAVENIEKQIVIENPAADIQTPEQILKDMPPDIQKELMDNAAEAHSYCERNYLLRNFYDCECWALEFLHDRIRKGPDVAFTTIVLDSEYSNCASAPKIAGYGYSRCHDIIYLDKISDEALEEICSCTGRALARDYAKRAVPRIKYINNMFRGILRDCRRNYPLR